MNKELLKSYSTLDIAGSETNVGQSVSHYRVFRKVLGYRWVKSNDYAFDVIRSDGKQLSFDVATGEKVQSENDRPELTGIIRKWRKTHSQHVLELDGGGNFHIRGRPLDAVESGARVWVTGQIRTKRVRAISGATTELPERQGEEEWHIFMEVEDCVTISKPFERPE